MILLMALTNAKYLFLGEKYVSDSKTVLGELTKKCRQLACFICEMFIVTCGVIVPPKTYFKHLYK